MASEGHVAPTHARVAPTHAELVPSLLDPGFYSHPVDRVELVQTHISYIFLAGDFVYKIKKPVDFGFLDFTTLDSRRYFCFEELRLNRRLAADVYLHVAPIEERRDGNLALGRPLCGEDDVSAEAEKVVEYALVMKRLPEERMLRRLLALGQVDLQLMDAIAQKLARFHAEAETGGEIDRIGGFEAVEHNARENFEQTERYIGVTIPDWQFEFLRAYNADFLERQRGLLEDRVRRGRVRDCHGDLHLDHICLAGGGDGITIFDCIEFNRRFRYGDVASEVAFLYMDLDFNGYHEFAQCFVEAYVVASGDAEVRALLPYFACYRAYVRGKVVSFRLDDPAIAAADREAAKATARQYFALAYRYAARLEKPTLIMVGGLMGTGKSTLAEAIAEPLGATVVRSDVVRKRLMGVPETEHHFDAFGAGLYTPEITRQTYEAALAEARVALARGESVIVDASFSRRALRQEAARVAQEVGAESVFIECRCPEEIVRERLERRLQQEGEPSDGRAEILGQQRQSWESVEGESLRVIELDSGRPPEVCAREAIYRVRIG